MVLQTSSDNPVFLTVSGKEMLFANHSFSGSTGMPV